MSIDYTKIFEASLNEIYIFNAETLNFIEVNRGARENLGYKMDELRLLTPLDIKPDFTRERFDALIAPLRSGAREKIVFETIHRRKDGTDYPVEVHLHMSSIEGEKVFVAIILDITERKKSEAAAAYGQSIIDSSNDAVISKTLDGTIVSWNQGAEHLYGYTAGEVIGKSISILIPPESQDDLPEILNRIRAGELVNHFEAVRIRKDGNHIDVSLTISPIRDRSNNITGASVIARDITQQKIARQRMIDLAVQRERSRMVQEFMRDSSHEFRNRLAIIGTKCDLIPREPVTEKQLEHIMVIVEQVGELDKLIDNMQELSTLQSTQAIKQRPININTLLEDVVEAVSQGEKAASVHIQMALTPDLPDVWAEYPLLSNALQRLVKNAVDFSEAGGEISIETSCKSDDRVNVVIRDNGIGIHTEDLPHIFDPFYRSDKARTLNGQFGMGLSIAQRIIDLHDGQIQIESTAGEGTTIHIELPVKVAVAATLR